MPSTLKKCSAADTAVKPLSPLYLLPVLLYCLSPALPAQEEAPFPGDAPECVEEGDDEELQIDLSAMAEQVFAAAEGGNAEAQFLVAQGYCTGKLRVGSVNYPMEQAASKALPWFCRAGEQGIAEASYCAGLAYLKGEGTAADAAKAVQWWKRALQQGHARAGMELSRLFFQGNAVEEAWEKALSYLQQAVVANRRSKTPDAAIPATLAVYYDKGIGTPQNRAAARPLLEEAAQLGNARAAFMLGLYHAEGLGGLPQDDAKAVALYRQAAIQEDKEAQCNLGTAYAMGTGTARDYALAAIWFRASALQGNTTAMVNLARCYLHGLGTETAPAKAKEWLETAAKQGSQEAAALLRQL